MEKHWIAVKHPSIGSGRIQRRVVKYKRKKRRKLAPIKIRKKNSFPIGAKSDKRVKGIKFPSPHSKRIFLYWVRLGNPFVKHKLNKTKASELAIWAIENTLRKKKKTPAEVIQAIDKCFSLFNRPAFKYRHWYGKKTLKLNHFFRYSKNTYRRLPEGMPWSWFTECCKLTTEKLEEKYFVKFPGSDQKIVQELKTIWKDYAQEDDFSFREEQDFQRVSVMVNQFYKANKDSLKLRHWSDVTGMLKNALVMWKTMTPPRLQILTMESFWRKDFPKELMRAKYGYRKQDINTDFAK